LDELRGTTEIRFDHQILPENFVPFVQQAVRRMRANQGSQGEPSIKRRIVEIIVEVERNEDLPQVPEVMKYLMMKSQWPKEQQLMPAVADFNHLHHLLQHLAKALDLNKYHNQ